jgi:hypothetical protein
MNTMPTDEVILKQDVLGRVRTPKERRELLLDEFERSGVPGVKFAELVGIKYQTFATWIQKRRRKRGGYRAVSPSGIQTAKKQVRWLEATMAATPGGVVKAGDSALTLHLSGAARMEISDARQIDLAVALLRALQKTC